MGCDSESIESKNQVFDIPEWLKGDYEGVHTQEYLKISSQKIIFKVDTTIYEFEPSSMISQTEQENNYIISTDSDILIFNKTTLQTEINFHFNDLNLGWFRNEKIE